MVACASCGETNADGARFCSGCGARLAGSEQRRERKFATALFADLVGSTALGEREDPEVVQSLVSRTFARLTTEVERFGGTVDKVMGDAILAVFGVPAAHEDDPERAVRAALEMQAVLAELNRATRTEARPALEMRIGIEAGEVVVHLERASDLPDRMLTGDAVNTASRLQTAAVPGSVVVGPTVYAATRTVIEYRELAPIELKGKAQAVPAWEAERVTARPGERPRLGLEARLVGRDEELTSLKHIFHRAQQNDKTALVTVIGAAGVGKSRLTLELETYVRGLPGQVAWLKGRCLAYGNLPYSALAEAVRTHAGVLEDDAPAEISSKVQRLVEGVFGDTASAPHVGVLCGLEPDMPLSSEDLFEAWRRFFECLASASGGLTLVMEDLHWADGGLLAFVEHLAGWGQGPILLLTLARPELLEVRPNWGSGRRNYVAMGLDPLSREECGAMLDDLIETGLPQGLRDLVLERAEGNPLFAEEIVRALIDRGILRPVRGAAWELAAAVDAIDLPGSVQALIASRLDTLPAPEKALLQDASVVGRFFWSGALAALGDGTDPREALGRLVVKELIVPRSPSALSGEAEFGFRHVLIRDVANASLPKAGRASKHVRVARWLVERAGERADDFASIVATHYAEAEGYLRELGDEGAETLEVRRDALRWARAAAARSAALWDGPERARWQLAAAELAERLALPAPELASAWEEAGEAAYSVRPMAEVQRAYERASELVGARDDAVGSARFDAALAFCATQSGNAAVAEQLIARAWPVLEAAPDSPEVFRALWFLGNARFLGTRSGDVEPLIRRIVDGTSPGEAMHERAAWGLGGLLLQTGRAREGIELIRAAREWAGRARDIEILLRSTAILASYARTADPAPDLDATREELEEAIGLARASGRLEMLSWLTGELGRIDLVSGRLEEAQALLGEAAEGAKLLGITMFAAINRRQQALAAAMRGDRETAEVLEADAAAMYEGRDSSSIELRALIEAALLTAPGDPGRTHLDILVDAARSLHEGSAEPMAGAMLLPAAIRALARAGRAEEAAELLPGLKPLAQRFAAGVPYLAWAKAALVADDADRVAAFTAASEAFGARGSVIEQARALMDAAEAASEAGADSVPMLVRARELLEPCGAGLYLAQVDRALAGTA